MLKHFLGINMNCLYCKKEIQEGSVYCNWCGRKQVRTSPTVHRRAQGSGTIRRLPGKRVKKWQAVAPAVKIDNQLVRTTVGLYETRADAEKALALYGSAPTSQYADFTLMELWKKYKETQAYKRLSDSAQRWNNSGYQRLKTIWHMKFKNIRKEDFQRCIDAASDKSHSLQSSIKTVATVLSDYAVSLDIIPHTYALRLLLPKKEKKEKPVFTADEVQKIMKAEGRWEDSIKILLYTGMRINEAMSIKLEDIRDGIIYCGGTKTDAAERIIPVHPKIQPIIDRAKGPWLIGGERRIRDDTYRKDHYYPTLEKLGISRVPPHGCRRWFFSQMDQYAGDSFAMTKIGGHTDPAFTERVYVSADIDRLRTALNKIP